MLSYLLLLLPLSSSTSPLAAFSTSATPTLNSLQIPRHTPSAPTALIVVCSISLIALIAGCYIISRSSQDAPDQASLASASTSSSISQALGQDEIHMPYQGLVQGVQALLVSDTPARVLALLDSNTNPESRLAVCGAVILNTFTDIGLHIDSPDTLMRQARVYGSTLEWRNSTIRRDEELIGKTFIILVGPEDAIKNLSEPVQLTPQNRREFHQIWSDYQMRHSWYHSYQKQAQLYTRLSGRPYDQIKYYACQFIPAPEATLPPGFDPERSWLKVFARLTRLLPMTSLDPWIGNRVLVSGHNAQLEDYDWFMGTIPEEWTQIRNDAQVTRDSLEQQGHLRPKLQYTEYWLNRAYVQPQDAEFARPASPRFLEPHWVSTLSELKRREPLLAQTLDNLQKAPMASGNPVFSDNHIAVVTNFLVI